MKWAAERARKRGVSVKIYASKPAQRTVNGLLALGIEVFKRPPVKDHYLVADSKSYVHSKPHPPILGERAGEVHINKYDPSNLFRVNQNIKPPVPIPAQ